MAGLDRLTALNTPQSKSWVWLMTGALVMLPYLMASSLLVVVGCLLWGLTEFPREILLRLHRHGWGVLTVLLLLSAVDAANFGEASLQLVHFLPYYLWWSVNVSFLTRTEETQDGLEQWAWVLVVGSLPGSWFAIGEYLAKSHIPVAGLQRFQWGWPYSGNMLDPRAYGWFHSPNVLANYTVMILGLALGLLWLRWRRSPQGSWPATVTALGRDRVVLILSIISLLGALYASGSRNGYLVALVLIVWWLVNLRQYRWVCYGGWVICGGLLSSVLTVGIGGRQLSWDWVTDDPRVYVWRLALRLIQADPWLGHGLGNYKFLYDGSVPGYDGMPHAHNLWLSLGAEAGIPAAIALTVIVGWICYRAVRRCQQLAVGDRNRSLMMVYGGCFLAVTLFGLFDVTLYDARINILAWLSLSVIHSLGVLSTTP
jgi:O-antigen ligase